MANKPKEGRRPPIRHAWHYRWPGGDIRQGHFDGRHRLDIVSVTDENVVNGLAFTEFAALIKPDVFVVTVGAEGGEPAVEVL